MPSANPLRLLRILRHGFKPGEVGGGRTMGSSFCRTSSQEATVGPTVAPWRETHEEIDTILSKQPDETRSTLHEKRHLQVRRLPEAALRTRLPVRSPCDSSRVLTVTRTFAPMAAK